MENINKTIGKNLLTLRKKQKLTQMELADKFNYSDKSISKWETGESLPSIEVLYELANFYGVTLNDLVSEEEQKTEIVQAEKHTPKMFSTKLIVTLLSVAAVWFVATAIFVCLKIFLDYTYPMCFLWATIPTCIVLIVFNSIWGKWRFLFPILSALLWSLLVSVHIQLLTIANIWPIYIIGAPLQVCVILWGALVKKPVWYNKQLKENKKQEKKKLKEQAKKGLTEQK